VKAQHHIVSGGIASLLLIPLLGVNSMIFWASSVLIDADHYLDYLYRNRFTDFSLRRMFTFHKYLLEKDKEPNFLGLDIMHTVEFLSLLGVVVALTGLAWLAALLWGTLFHMALDLIYLYRRGAIFCRALSVIEYAIRWNRLKLQGLQPEAVYQSILKAMFCTTEYKSREDHKAADWD